MKRLCILIMIAALILTSAALAEEPVLNIYTWDNYFAEDVLSGFTAETGIEINYSVFASNEEMLLKMQAGDGSDYDIILASDYAISTLNKDGALMPLHKDLLPNRINLNPDYLNQYFDPDGSYAVPYVVGSPVIVYDPDQVEGKITRFADLWDAQFADGLWLIDDARVTTGEVLKMLGYSYNTTDPDQLNAAYERLCALKDNIHVLDYDMTYDYFLTGEVKAAYLFTQSASYVMLENPNLKCAFPAEGIGFGIDAFVIPANAAHPENAHAFLNYLMDADVARTTAEWLGYINPNAAADPLIDPDFAAMECFHIPAELLPTAEYVRDLGADESLYQDLWMNFKLS